MTNQTGHTGPPGHTGAEGGLPSLRVRPYMVTGGRTKAEVDLEIETMVRCADDTPAWTNPTDRKRSKLIAESRTILDLCETPQSIAEISAHLQLPLQVAKVLAADLIVAGLLSTDSKTRPAGNRPDLALLERVLDGLQSL